NCLRSDSQVSRRIANRQSCGEKISPSLGMGSLARVAHRHLLRPHRLLSDRQRKLHHSAFPRLIRGRILVHRIDVAASGTFRRPVTERRDSYQAIPGRRLIMRKLTLVLLVLTQIAFSLDRQPNAVYHSRRQALASKLDGGVALIFAPVEAEGPNDLYGFRQDDNFYYLTGWTEP